MKLAALFGLILLGFVFEVRGTFMVQDYYERCRGQDISIWRAAVADNPWRHDSSRGLRESIWKTPWDCR